MASDIALDAISAAKRPIRVLDPMCGSGTVLTQGMAAGHTVTGFDLDPLAILMSRVATQPVDLDRFDELAASCVAEAKKSRVRKGRWSDAETGEFASYWFGRPQHLGLVRLSEAIREVEPSPERDAVEIALSRIIVTKSPRASLAADTAHSRPHRVITESDYDVLDGFAGSCVRLRKLLAARELPGAGRVRRGDARDRTMFRGASVDLVVTSPPYLNAIDYLRGHRLALIWLGYSLPELRSIRSTSIGAEGRLKTADVKDFWQVLRGVMPEADTLDTSTRHMIERYAVDMRLFASNVNHVLVKRGGVVAVVADSVLRGQRIPTGAIVENALAESGLKVTEVVTREIPATLRYMPVANAGEQLGKRMKHEYVITAKKEVA